MSAHDWPVEVDPIFGCWRWLGKFSSNGRPVIWRGKQPSYAYRVIYEAEVGPVPDGLVLDHECRSATQAQGACVNPLHLRAVTKSINELRKSWAYRCRIKTCRLGHSMKDALVTTHYGRLCRTCHRGQKEMGCRL